MKRAAALMLCLCVVSWTTRANAYLPSEEDGPHRVAVERLTLTDRQRGGREVPIKVYRPADVEEPAPVVLFSHGLGGSREGYAYLGRYWASHGYISVHLQHAGSDDAVWRDVPAAQRMRAIRTAASSATVALDRAHDVPFVLDELERLDDEADSSLRGRLDVERVALAGHSFGAWSALVGGGQTLVSPSGRAMRIDDARIDAIIPLSAPVPRSRRQRQRAFQTIAAPALHMTGTHDESPIRNTKPDERRIPFDQTPGPDADGSPSYLIIFEGADHMTFAGRRRPGGPADAGRRDAAHHPLIRAATLAFLDAYLRDDPAARAWLDGDGFPEMLGDEATLERKTR